MLCRLCAPLQEIDLLSISYEHWGEPNSLEHHLSYADLEASASGGCEVCALFLLALDGEKEYQRTFSKSPVGRMLPKGRPKPTDDAPFVVNSKLYPLDTDHAPWSDGVTGLVYRRQNTILNGDKHVGQTELNLSTKLPGLGKARGAIFYWSTLIV